MRNVRLFTGEPVTSTIKTNEEVMCEGVVYTLNDLHQQVRYIRKDNTGDNGPRKGDIGHLIKTRTTETGLFFKKSVKEYIVAFQNRQGYGIHSVHRPGWRPWGVEENEIEFIFQTISPDEPILVKNGNNISVCP